MLKRTYLIKAAVAAVVVMAAGPAMAQTPKSYPKPVQDHLKSLSGMCAEVGGRFLDPASAMRVADFNGDGRADYGVYQGELICDGAASLYGGNAGSPLTVFVSTPAGYKEGWGGYVYAANLDKSAAGAKLWVDVAGADCGSKVKRSFATEVFCARALMWVPAKGEFTFEPLTKMRLIQ
ncbi:hypothetical protein [Asticcacaulis machinosus]|uniref:FG-GAP repeat-containing protein n=1 Tax=Asticcacaulis machinosus TaxID=2984211 RepID=A0ABT5HGR9_9CAUL|nr:hypothetical protein [Asticcacaulis machinosus]MDC7675451.1 hypothetical protein [Asticcacaulis machinosus]